MSEAIRVGNLGKRYYRYHADRPRTLHEALLRGVRKLKPAETFWVLRHVSFCVTPGRMVGVIGRNGAGKSTLLRLLGSIGRPDEGSVKVNGRVGALLNLGLGFHPDLTGRENIFINGVISGLTRREVESRLDSIIAFSELEDYMGSPLRTYSTGMQMRLAFSIAMHSEPGILLIDEALAVGDMAFQRKCIDQINRLRAQGCTIILVSHEVALIREMCNDAIWLSAGRQMVYGPADLVVDAYVAEAGTETRCRPSTTPTVLASNGTKLGLNESRFGSLELEITSARLLNAMGMPTSEIDSGDPLSIEINYQARIPVENANFQVYIYRADDVVCCDLGTLATTPELSSPGGEGQIILHLERLDLNQGLYHIDVATYRHDWSYAYDYHYKIYSLVVRPTGIGDGLLRPSYRWEGATLLEQHKNGYESL